MAGQPISITRGTTTLTQTTTQPITDVLDLQGVSGSRFDIALRSYYITGTGSPSATIVLQTSMFNDDNPTNWSDLLTFTAVSSSNVTGVDTVSQKVLRYLRWKVTLTGTTPSFTFELLGMAW